MVDVEHGTVVGVAVGLDPGGEGAGHVVDLVIAALKGSAGHGHGGLEQADLIIVAQHSDADPGQL